MSVEEAARPRLRGKAAAVVGSLERSVVLSASYKARSKGVRAGQTIYEARRRCPEITLVQSSFKKYTYISSQIAGFIKTVKADARMYSVDEAFIDITDLPESSEELGYRIKTWIKLHLGITGSVGVGQSYIVAKMASNVKKPDGFYEVSGSDTILFIDGFKLGDIWGIGGRTVEKLGAMGLFTPSDVRSYGKDKLMELYGLPGLYIYNACSGIDREYPIGRDVLPKSVSHSITTKTDIACLDIVMAYLLQLSEAVSSKMRQKLYAGRTVCLTVRYSDMSTRSFRRQLGFFTSATHHIYAAVKALFIENYCLSSPLRLFGVGVSDLSHGGAIFFNMDDIIEGVDDQLTSLYQVIDSINSKYSCGIMRGSTLKIDYRGEHIAPAFSSIPSDFG